MKVALENPPQRVDWLFTVLVLLSTALFMLKTVLDALAQGAPGIVGWDMGAFLMGAAVVTWTLCRAMALSLSPQRPFHALAMKHLVEHQQRSQEAARGRGEPRSAARAKELGASNFPA